MHNYLQLKVSNLYVIWHMNKRLRLHRKSSYDFSQRQIHQMVDTESYVTNTCLFPAIKYQSVSLCHNFNIITITGLTNEHTPWRQNRKAHHRVHNSPPPTLSSAKWIHSTPPKPVFLRSNLIPSTHLRHGLLNDLFLSGFPQNFVHFSVLSHECHMPLPTSICLSLSA
jgi:hypothetical protein